MFCSVTSYISTLPAMFGWPVPTSPDIQMTASAPDRVSSEATCGNMYHWIANCSWPV